MSSQVAFIEGVRFIRTSDATVWTLTKGQWIAMWDEDDTGALTVLGPGDLVMRSFGYCTSKRLAAVTFLKAMGEEG